MATAIVESQADYTYWLPFNLGDVVLDRLPPQDEWVRLWVVDLISKMDVKRADGMTDDDFREYWNEPEVARRMGVVTMRMTRMAMYIDTLENRGPWESEEHAHSAAARRVKSRHGIYAHPRPDDDPSDPHRTLPFEVQTRVTRFLDVFNSDITNLTKRLDAAGSVDSFYRASLR